MPWLNEEVAGLLREYAELTQITGGDPFRACHAGSGGPRRAGPEWGEADRCRWPTEARRD